MSAIDPNQPEQPTSDITPDPQPSSEPAPVAQQDDAGDSSAQAEQSIPAPAAESNDSNSESNDQEHSPAADPPAQPSDEQNDAPAATDSETSDAEPEKAPIEHPGPANAVGTEATGLPPLHAGDPAAVQCPVCQHRFIPEPEGHPADMDGATSPS